MFNLRANVIVPPGSAVPLLVRAVALPDPGRAPFTPLLQFIAALRVAMTAIRGRFLAPADRRSALVLFVLGHEGERRKNTPLWQAQPERCRDSQQADQQQRTGE